MKTRQEETYSRELYGKVSHKLLDLCLMLMLKALPKSAMESQTSKDDEPSLTDDMIPHLTYTNLSFKSDIISSPSKPSFNSLCVSLLNRPKPRNEPSSLGNIKLPNELLNMVLLALSFKTLMAFMTTNSSARHTVLAMPAFHNLVQHGYKILRTLLRIRPLEFPIGRIHDVLTNPSCVYCANFGGYVFLPGLLRCCQWCAEKDKRMIPITKNTVQNTARYSDYKLKARSIADLPVMESLPGRYAKLVGGGSVEFKMYKKKVYLFSQPLAQDAMTAQYLKENPGADPSSAPQMRIPQGTYEDELRVGC